MSKQSFDPKECINALNGLKRGLQWKNRPIDRETLLNSLKSCGLPYNNNFWMAFRKSGIVKEVSKGQYLFTSKDDISVDTLYKIKSMYQDITRSYKKSKEKPVHEEAGELTDELPEDDPVAMTQFAIDLLKEQGYRIMKPVGVVYEQV